MTVASIFGGPTGEMERSELCVKVLRDVLEMAEAGKIVGVAISAQHHDGNSEYQIGGRVGGYSMIGAIEAAKDDLVQISRGDE